MHLEYNLNFSEILVLLLEKGASLYRLGNICITPFFYLCAIERANTYIITTEIARRKVLNENVSLIDINMLLEESNLVKYYDECLNQIENMRKIYLFNDYTLFSIFVLKVKDLARILRNKPLVNKLKNLKLNNISPRYGKFISIKCEKAIKIINKWEKEEMKLSKIFESHLPRNVIELISYNISI